VKKIMKTKGILINTFRKIMVKAAMTQSVIPLLKKTGSAMAASTNV
jgi:hypothetical protein